MGEQVEGSFRAINHYACLRAKFSKEKATEPVLARSEVALIEEALGVAFPETPLKATPSIHILAKEMKSILAAVYPAEGGRVGKRLKDLRNQLLGIIAAECTRRTGAGGLYSQVSGVCYILDAIEYSVFGDVGKIGIDRETSFNSLHEAMHSYHGQRDTSGLVVGTGGLQTTANLLTDIRSGRISPDKVGRGVEKLITDRIFVEGIAEYGARYANALLLEKWIDSLVAGGMNEERATRFSDNIMKTVIRSRDIAPESIENQVKVFKADKRTDSVIGVQEGESCS